MKTILSLLILIFSFSSFAITMPEIEALLKEKNISLQKLEEKGAKVLLGEVTGHNSALPFSKVQVLVTKDEAILKKDIDLVDFKGSQILGNVIAVHSQGQYVLQRDVQAVIILGQ